MAELDGTLTIISNYGKKCVVPMWMKQALEGAGLIDDWGGLVSVPKELEDAEDSHFRMYHDD